jgi:hypothetical protein|tara:strand:- start:42 stop:395 length:354 start_codon:yes stop_codon:yes gene_type:complete
MASLYWKVKTYLEANSKTESEFDSNIILRNDGSGDYIHTWSVSGLNKPTDSQLTSADTQATKDYNNSRVRKTRKKSYGDIGDQLDLLYKDMLAGKGDSTGEWFKSIKAVKDANAKEE